jgi:flagellin-like protein
MRNIKRNRRAVSPVLSTVLLILIVVVGMSMVFAFFVDYVADYQSGRGSSVMERIEIEDVRFVSNDTIEMWLYNYGEIEAEFDLMFVNGLAVKNFTYTGAIPGLYDMDSDGTLELPAGAHARFNVTLNYDWAPDFPYNIRIVTERGSAFEREYYSPEL